MLVLEICTDRLNLSGLVHFLGKGCLWFISIAWPGTSTHHVCSVWFANDSDYTIVKVDTSAAGLGCGDELDSCLDQAVSDRASRGSVAVSRQS